jgi:hypothetical protein
MKPIPLLLALLAMICFSAAIGMAIEREINPCTCPETLPTQVTDMFTITGDTIYLKQDVDFVISTRGIDIDTAGIIHRKNLHK